MLQLKGENRDEEVTSQPTSPEERRKTSAQERDGSCSTHEKKSTRSSYDNSKESTSEDSSSQEEGDDSTEKEDAMSQKFLSSSQSSEEKTSRSEESENIIWRNGVLPSLSGSSASHDVRLVESSTKMGRNESYWKKKKEIASLPSVYSEEVRVERSCAIVSVVKREDRLPLVSSGESTLVKDEAKKASHIKTSTSKTSCLLEKSTLPQALSIDTLARSTILSRGEPKDLVSSSMYNLFSGSGSSSSLLRLDLCQEVDDDDHHLRPYLYAAVRADFTAGNPFLKYLKGTRPNPKAANYLLFWQSVENILTQDEMRRWYTSWCSSEHLGDKPTPYLSYFEPCFVAKNLQELCLFFLQPKSLHRISLPKDIEEGLQLLLCRGLGQGLLLAAQEHAGKVCRTLYSSCRKLLQFLSSLLEPDWAMEGVSAQ